MFLIFVLLPAISITSKTHHVTLDSKLNEIPTNFATVFPEVSVINSIIVPSNSHSSHYLINNREGSVSLDVKNSNTPNGALLETETKSGGNFPLIFEENFTDISTYNELNNQDSFTVNTLENDTFNRLNANVSTYLSNSVYSIEDESTAGDLSFSGNTAYAQGVKIPFVKENSKITISSFNITTFRVFDGDLVGQVWTAVEHGTNSSRIQPGVMVANKSITLSPTGFVNVNQTFTFDIPGVIDVPGTYYNASGEGSAFIFFIVYSVPISTGALFNKNDHTNDGVNDGFTFTYNNGSDPQKYPANSNDWVEVNYDIEMDFNASFILNPSTFETNVWVDGSSTPVLANGSYTESTLRTVSTDYKLNYSTSIALNFGITPLIKVTYTSFVNFLDTSFIKYTITPNLSNVEWKIQLNDSTYPSSSSSIVKYFKIPNNFLITNVYLNNSVLIATPGQYTTGIDQTMNQLIYIEVAHGNYTVFATSTNLLQTAIVQTYIDNTGWIEQNNATMGVIYPIGSETAGDIVKANITNIGGLGLAGGTVNGSLRTSTGQILGYNSIGSYTDTSDFSQSTAFGATIEFITELDPNIPTGYWTFQFRWFNGTAAGAVAFEFIILPEGFLDLISPSESSIEVLEGARVNIEIQTLDLSHNSNWGSPGTVLWDFGVIVMNYNGLSGSYHNHSTSIDTSIGSNNVQPNQAYTIIITFTDGPFTITTEFVMTTYYRGGSQLSNTDPVEFGSTFGIEYRPLNLTQGGSFKNPSITFQLTSNQVLLDVGIPTYNSGTGNYSIVVQWNSQFKLGSSNEIVFNWTLAGFGDVNSYSHVSSTFTFQVIDTNAPSLTLQSNVVYNEGVTGNNITWDPIDPHPGVYNLSRDGSIIAQNVPWSNSSNIVIIVDGLAARISVYTYAINIFDISGVNVVADSVDVTVNDITAPTFSSLAPNIPVLEGFITDELSWTLNDLHGKNYTIVQNGSGVVESGPWITDGYIVNYTIPTGLTLGTYNFTIKIYDESENYAEYSTIVTVVDDTGPILSLSPNDLSYEEFDTGDTITWSITDTNAQNYILYLDGDSIDNQSWTSGVDIIIMIEGLSLGQHNYTIEVFDTTGNRIVDIVIVTVTDSVPPNVSGPADFEYLEGEINNNITWVVFDNHPTTYSIYRNDVEIVPSTTWSSGSIIIPIDGLGIGSYNFTIFLADSSGNVNRDTVYIEVKGPQIIQTKLVDFEITDSVFEGDVETLSIEGWKTIDDSSIQGGNLSVVLVARDVQGFNNGDFVTISTFSSSAEIFEVTLNYNGLSNGTYEWFFTFERDGFESQTSPIGAYNVTILPHTISIVISYESTLVRNEEFKITVQVSYNDQRLNSILGLNTLAPKTGGVEDIDIEFSLIYLSIARLESILSTIITTNENGIAIWTLSSDQTSTIQELVSISASLANQPGGFNSGSRKITNIDIKVKSGETSSIIPEEYLIYILVAIGVFLLFIGFRMIRSRKKEEFVEVDDDDEPKLSKKERKALEKSKKERLKTQDQEAEAKIRQMLLDKKLEKQIKTLEKVAGRSTQMSLSRLAVMMEMGEDGLLKWLYELPDDFGFNIHGDMVEFNVVDIDASIDNLISSFAEMEEKKEGKLE